MIENTSVPLPQVIDDERVQTCDDAIHTRDSVSRYDGFIQSSKLFKILSQIMTDMCLLDEMPKDIRPGQLLNRAMAINRQLDNFTEALPVHLKYLQSQSPAAARDGHVRLQQLAIARGCV